MGSATVSLAAPVQRYIDPTTNAGNGYRHYASPVAGTTVADLGTSSFTPMVNPAAVPLDGGASLLMAAKLV